MPLQGAPTAHLSFGRDPMPARRGGDETILLARASVRGRQEPGRERGWQGHTLVHSSAQPDLFFTEITQRTPPKALTSSRIADECKTLIAGVWGESGGGSGNGDGNGGGGGGSGAASTIESHSFNGDAGRGLHSYTFQFNLSRFCHTS
jgi:hypothetical protein